MKNEFQEFHDEMRKLSRPKMFYPIYDETTNRFVKGHPSVPYVRPVNPGEIKGKRNIRFAKRERVRAMKAAQGV